MCTLGYSVLETTRGSWGGLVCLGGYTRGYILVVCTREEILVGCTIVREYILVGCTGGREG